MPWEEPFYPIELTLGLTYLKLKEYEDAVNYFEQCLKIDPEYVAAINGLGVVYKEKNQFDQAIDFFKQAFEIKSDFYDTNFNLGSCYISSHRYEEALNYLLAAQKIKPDAPELFNELGILYDSTGQFDLALSDLADVNTAGQTDGAMMQFDGSSGKYEIRTELENSNLKINSGQY